MFFFNSRCSAFHNRHPVEQIEARIASLNWSLLWHRNFFDLKVACTREYDRHLIFKVRLKLAQNHPLNSTMPNIHNIQIWKKKPDANTYKCIAQKKKYVHGTYKQIAQVRAIDLLTANLSEIVDRNEKTCATIQSMHSALCRLPCISRWLTIVQSSWYQSSTVSTVLPSFNGKQDRQTWN